VCDKLYSLDSFARYSSYANGIIPPRQALPLAKHEKIIDIKDNMLDEHFDDYYKFGFVRNPWDWLVSYYFYFKKLNLADDDQNPGKLLILSGGAMKVAGSDVDDLGKKIKEKREIGNISFKEFLLIIKGESENYKKGRNLNQIEYPYQPQHGYLVDEDENLMVDFVGKYENLSIDWGHLCDRLKLANCRHSDMNLMCHNQSAHLDYRSYYDESTAEMVYDVYRKDIELFDYSF